MLNILNWKVYFMSGKWNWLLTKSLAEYSKKQFVTMECKDDTN